MITAYDSSLVNYLIYSINEADDKAKADKADKADKAAPAPTPPAPPKKEEDKKDKKTENEININDRKTIFNNVVNRLAYIKYLIDNETNNKLKKKLKTLFDLFAELSFKDGSLRTIVDILNNIKDIERDNKGQIPGLPSDKVIKALDTKMIRFKDYDKDTFDTYVNDIKDQFGDEHAEKDGDKSEADTILNNPNKVLKIKGKEEDDIISSLETAEKSNPGICRVLGVIDISSGLSIKKSHTPEDDKEANKKDNTDNENSEEDEITKELTKGLPDDIKSLMGESRISLFNHIMKQINE